MRMTLQSPVWTGIRVAIYLLLAAACVVFYIRQSDNIAAQRDVAKDILLESRWNVERLEVELLRTQDALSTFAANPYIISADAVRVRIDILWARLEPIRSTHDVGHPDTVSFILDLVDSLQTVLEQHDMSIQTLKHGQIVKALWVRNALEPFVPQVRDAVLMVNSPEVSRRFVERLELINSDAERNNLWLLGGFLLLAFAIIAELVVSQRRARRVHEAMIEVRKADVAKVNFLANMSHELRTPLNAIIGFSDIMRTEAFGPVSPPTYRSYAGDIHSSGQQLLAMVTDILELARLETGTISPDVRAFNVTDEIALAMRMTSVSAKEKHIRLERIDEAEDLPCLLLSDPRLFRQTILNLLTNAVTFTPDGGRILVSTRRQNGFYEVVVRDSGMGIAPEDLEKVTDKFYQVAIADTRSHGGMGLGLSIAKSFTELTGGELDIMSRLGEGTEVTLRYPESLLRTASPEA